MPDSNQIDVFEWLLRLEDRPLSGLIVSLHDGAGLTRFGLTTLNDSDAVPPSYFSTMPTASAIQVARNFYKVKYWDALHLDEIPMPLAASILSCAVVCGYSAALRFYDYAKATSNGPDSLLSNFIARWKIHNKWLATTRPTDARFLTGWNNRASAIYPELP